MGKEYYILIVMYIVVLIYLSFSYINYYKERQIFLKGILNKTISKCYFYYKGYKIKGVIKNIHNKYVIFIVFTDPITNLVNAIYLPLHKIYEE